MSQEPVAQIFQQGNALIQQSFDIPHPASCEMSDSLLKFADISSIVPAPGESNLKSLQVSEAKSFEDTIEDGTPAVLNDGSVSGVCGFLYRFGNDFWLDAQKNELIKITDWSKVRLCSEDVSLEFLKRSISAQSNNPGPVALRYSANSLSWRAKCSISANIHTQTVNSLSVFAFVKSQEPSSVHFEKVILSVSAVGSGRGSSRNSGAKSIQAYSASLSYDSLGETGEEDSSSSASRWVFDNVELQARESKLFNLVTLGKIELKETHGFWNVYQGQFSDTPQSTELWLRLANTAANGLGLNLPPASVELFEQAEGTEILTNTCFLPESVPGDTIRMQFENKDPRVTCKKTQLEERTQLKGYGIAYQKVEVVFQNNDKRVAHCELREQGDMDIKSKEDFKRVGDIYSFRFDLEAGAKRVFTYERHLVTEKAHA